MHTATTLDLDGGKRRKCPWCKIILAYLFITFTIFILMYCFWFNTLIRIINNLPGTVHLPDTNRDLFELIESRGFKHESHYINTGNGYILLMVQIINPYIDDDKRKTLRPVFLQHGFQTDGEFWLISRDGYLSNDTHEYHEYADEQIIIDNEDNVGSSLGFVLAAREYDVWIGNYRGSPYSINHTDYDPWRDSDFWAFSMDEMIEEDLKSSIDYIINKTEHTSISYIGHSQGTLMMFGLLTTHPQYADLIKPFIAIAPAFYLTKVQIPIEPFIPETLLLKYLSWPKYIPNNKNFMKFLSNLCENFVFKQTCYLLHYLFFGSYHEHSIYDRIGVYWSVMMTGSSSWNMAHILKNIIAGEPCFYDYDDENLNLEKYGSPTPPRYNTSNINSTDIALIYSRIDYFTSLEGVIKLKEKLRVKLLYDYMVPDDKINHLDLVRSNSTGLYVNKPILEILSRYR